MADNPPDLEAEERTWRVEVQYDDREVAVLNRVEVQVDARQQEAADRQQGRQGTGDLAGARSGGVRRVPVTPRHREGDDRREHGRTRDRDEHPRRGDAEPLRLDRAASFVFRISGSSMIEAGIHDNDVVVVDRDTRPVEGHIVIAIVDGGFVCRQLVRRSGAMFLEARNSRQCYEATSAEGVEIWGVVRTGVRDYRR